MVDVNLVIRGIMLGHAVNPISRQELTLVQMADESLLTLPFERFGTDQQIQDVRIAELTFSGFVFECEPLLLRIP